MLTPATEALIALAIEEDLGRGDVTSDVIFGDAAAEIRGRVTAREPLVVAGVEVAREVFRRVDGAIRFDAALADGQRVDRGDVVALVSGPARGVLGGERTALNFLQRLSGIATLTRRFVDAVAGTGAIIVDTRKTAPGWRALDKAAVVAGGGRNHRADLASGVLIKDNHIAACGGVRAAVERARARAPHGLRIEVEVDSIDQLDDALAAGAEVILLDNMDPPRVRAAVERIARRALVEVSGGVTLDTVRGLAEAGADRISIGALTHSPRAVDLGLDL
ncbi:MAG TPA: carboxylating nicotinate-nucleotide diphosphorylase [Polyangia bacterium]|nr:carboxylating nicotinate-nucleotide diphosphorylase [Polyangia bacterium]